MIEVRIMNSVNALLVAENPKDSATRFIMDLEGYLDEYASGQRKAPCEWLKQEADSRVDFPDSYIRFLVEYVGTLPMSDGRICVWVAFKWTVEHVPRNS